MKAKKRGYQDSLKPKKILGERGHPDWMSSFLYYKGNETSVFQ